MSTFWTNTVVNMLLSTLLWLLKATSKEQQQMCRRAHKQ